MVTKKKAAPAAVKALPDYYTPAQAIEWLQKLPADEPVFVLAGRDNTAAASVSHWMVLNHQQLRERGSDAKLDSARKTRDAMDIWPGASEPD